MFVLKNLAHIFGFIFVGGLILSAGVHCFACEENGDDTEWERQSGWQEHKKKEEHYELKRLSGRESFKKRKEWWERKLSATIVRYKQEKLLMEKALDENGPEYQAHLEMRLQEAERADQARRKYVAEGLCRKEKLKANILSEEEELDLLGKMELRELNKRPTGISGKLGSGEESSGLRDYSGESKPPAIEPTDRGSSPPPNGGRPLDDLDDFDSPPMFDDPDF